MECVIRVISEALTGGSPRESAEQCSSAFLRWVKDNPDGFDVLTHDAPPIASRGGFSSLPNEVAERVSDVFAKELKKAGYDGPAQSTEETNTNRHAREELQHAPLRKRQHDVRSERGALCQSLIPAANVGKLNRARVVALTTSQDVKHRKPTMHQHANRDVANR